LLNYRTCNLLNFVYMINIGLIGKIDSVESMASMLRNFPELHIAGKSSSGFLTRQDGFQYSIPELNKTDLIEKSDVIFFVKGAKLTSELAANIIRQSKHIFISDYFYPSPDELTELSKLLAESESVFQVHNPFLYLPLIQWTRQNIPLPAYFDLNFLTDMVCEQEILIKLLLLPTGFLGVLPIKIRQMNLIDLSCMGGFANIRLEYGDSSVFNFNLMFRNQLSCFDLKVWSGRNYLHGDLISGSSEFDLKQIQHEKSDPRTELSDFFRAINGQGTIKTGIAEYISIINIVMDISRKNEW
jgi:hypothetical protein